MLNKFKFILILLMLISSLKIYCQEPIFSHFNNTMNFTNPSLIALSNNWSFKFIRRDQWIRIPSKFITNGFSFETSVGRFGYAISYSQNTEGELSFRNQDFSTGFSAYIPIGKSINLRFGFSLRLLNRSIDFSNISFFGNLDPLQGNINNINYSFNNSFSEINPDLSQGLGINYLNISSGNKNFIFNSFRLGFSLNNILKQEKGLISNSISYLNYNRFPFPMKFTFYGFHEYKKVNNNNLNNPKSILFSQSYFYQISGPLSTFQLNLLNIDNGPIDIGVGFRTQGISIDKNIKRESVICKMGLQQLNKTSSITLGVSYDFTISQLNNISSGGTFEMMVIIESITGGIFDGFFSEAKLKKWRKKQVQCSRLGRPTYNRKLDGFNSRKKLIKTKMGKI
jgi:type IX secretion system PorP/SprF family membrane protein